MPRPCSICTHPDIEAINDEVANGEPLLRVSERHDVGRASLTRHRDRHLPLRVLGDLIETDGTGGSELGRLEALVAHADRIKSRAEHAGDLRLALSAISELAKLVELAAKLRGELDQKPVINVAVIPEWPRVLEALRRYPEAKLAVVKALE